MDQIGDIVALIGDVLGRSVVGIYLHGSAVLGGLNPASDLDVLAVCQRSMTARERRALVDGLLRISGVGGGARPAEVIVVVQSEVRPWRFPPRGDFLYGEWLREEIEVHGPPQPEPMPDLAVLITMVLAGDHTLSGLPPAQVLDPVPHGDLVRASVGGVPGLVDNLDRDTRNVVLTLARIWTTLATGEIRSKAAAADWALTRLPSGQRRVLEYAKHLYLNHQYAEERWDEQLRALVRPHVDYVVATIDRLSHQPSQP